nr:formyltransferase family protein [Motiliproteus sediminis]
MENNDQLQALVERTEPDVVFVCGWYRVIPEALISRPLLGFFGIHNSLLPRYRGHAPLIWSLLNGDAEVGASLFKFDQGMDTGDVYHQWSIPNDGGYVNSIIDSLDRAIEKSFGRVFDRVIRGEQPRMTQPHRDASYCAKRRPEDSAINWNRSAEATLRFIRTLSAPYPDSFTFIDSRKVYILKAEAFDFPISGIPGQVVCHIDRGAVICCGDGRGILVTEAADEQGDRTLASLFRRLSSPAKSFELSGKQ